MQALLCAAAEAAGPAGLLLLSLAAAVWCGGLCGFVVSFAHNYADGPGGSNNFSGVWISGFAMLLAVQAACVILTPRCSAGSTSDASRYRTWLVYSTWMWSCGLILLVSLAIALPAQSGWAVLWMVAAPIIAVAAKRHRHHQLHAAGSKAHEQEQHLHQHQHQHQPQGAEQQPESGSPDVEEAGGDGNSVPLAHVLAQEPDVTSCSAKTPLPLVEAPQRSSDSSARSVTSFTERCCTKTCWQQCCRGCGHCIIATALWSSLFWAGVLGLFLVIQSATLASDLRAFPPPGVLVEVPIALAGGGGNTTVQLHINCTGPSTPGLSTFILEAGGGAPGITMAGLADGLAAAGRRACWYDRLGYGWSDGAIKPTTSNRSTEALHALLAAVPPGMVPRPYIVVGHSAGGQLMLQYAASYPDDVAGIALLDSYSDVAIYLNLMRAANQTMATHQVVAPNGSTVVLPHASAYYTGTVPTIDLLRAVTPLAWARWITDAGRSGSRAAATSAMYGNNKEWHAQWVEVLSMARGWTTADSLTLSNGQAVWQGAGWPDFSPKPVLLMPANATLNLPKMCDVGTDYSLSTDCVNTVHDPQQFCTAAHGANTARVSRCLARFVYPDLYLAYLSTLSFNSTLFVCPGDHAFVWNTPDPIVEQLLAKFAGV